LRVFYFSIVQSRFLSFFYIFFIVKKGLMWCVPFSFLVPYPPPFPVPHCPSSMLPGPDLLFPLIFREMLGMEGIQFLIAQGRGSGNRTPPFPSVKVL